MRTRLPVIAAAIGSCLLPASAAAETTEFDVPVGHSVSDQRTFTFKGKTTYTITVSGTITHTYGLNTDIYDAAYKKQQAYDWRRDGSGLTLTAAGDTGAGQAVAEKHGAFHPYPAYREDHTYTFTVAPASETQKLAFWALPQAQPGPSYAEYSGGFHVKIVGPDPEGGETEKTACPASATIFARAAVDCPFGTRSTLPVPDPGEPADVSSARLPANTKTVDLDAELTDAEIDYFLGVLALVNRRVNQRRQRELNETLGACLVFNGADYDPADPLNGARRSAVGVACLEFLSRSAQAAPATIWAAARRCRVGVVPVWRRGFRPSARKRRKAAAAYGRLVNASCSSKAPGRLAFRVSARGKGATLNRLLGKRGRAGVVRSAPAGAKDGPNAKMTVRWRRR